jgi:ABC-2 type transport system ATP-binding protein
VAGIRERIERLARDKAVILSTHVLAEAQRLCTRVLILHDGRCVAEDETRRLGAAAQPIWRAILRREAPQLEERLASLEFLRRSIRVESSERRFVWRFELASAAAASELAAVLVHWGCALEEFLPERMELEDVFLRAIHGELSA